MNATTYADAVREMTRQLESAYTQQEAKTLALRLFSSRLGVPEYACWTDADKPVSEAIWAQWCGDVLQLLRHRPWQYVVGEAYFDGHSFLVNEAVLIPRPETEELVRLAADRVERRWGSRVSWLDVCTGSGCIAWSLAARFPEASVCAVDWSQAALSLAVQQPISSEECPVRSPFFLRADVLQGVPEDLMQETNLPAPGTWTALVSNPPYVRISERDQMVASVLDYEPEMALFVPDEDPLLFYRALMDWAKVLLCPGGQVFWEINEALGEDLCAMLRSEGFRAVELLEDFRGRPRFVLFEK